MADAKTANSYARPDLKTYESQLTQDAYDAREEESDDLYDEFKHIMKSTMIEHRKRLQEAGILEKGKQLTGYGKIDKKHIDKVSGKTLKEVYAQELLDQIGLYTMKKAGMSDGFIHEMMAGLNAQDKITKDGKEVAVPSHSRRSAYHAQLKSFMDTYFGRPGTYAALQKSLQDEKSIRRALKGELGQVFQQYALNLHPGQKYINEYQTHLRADSDEEMKFRGHVTGVAGKAGRDVVSSDLEKLITGHTQLIKSPGDLKDDDEALPKAKPKKK